MNIDDLATQLLFVTAPIWVERRDGKTSSGTAFFMNWPATGRPDTFVPLLVTAAHVVENATRGVFALARRTGDGPDKGQAINVEVEESFFANGLHSKLDLFAAPIAPVFQLLEQQRQPVFFRSVTPDLM